MKKKLLASLALSAWIGAGTLLPSPAAWAQAVPAAPAPAPAASAAATPAPAPEAAGELADGEVRRVDSAGLRVTLRHGEIKSLEMPPMTMVFQVREPGVLEGLKPGDKVRFRVVNEKGRLVITQMEPQR